MPPCRPGLSDLHVHFSGAIRPADYLRFLATRPPWLAGYEQAMAAAYGSRPPLRALLPRCLAGDPGAIAEFTRMFTFTDTDGGSFARFRAKLAIFSCTSVLTEPRGAAAEVLRGLREEARFFAAAIRAGRQREGVTYAETRVALGGEMTPEMMEAVLGELLDGRATAAGRPAEWPAERLIPTLPRSDPFPAWQVVRGRVLRPAGRGIAGIDLCGQEEGHPPAAQAALFQEVREFNDAHPERALAILYHVGEVFEDKSLESAVRWVHEAADLGAHRLGHAIALVVEPAALGRHSRRELVSERRDQLRYDLRHAHELRLLGVAVDEDAARADLRRLERRPADQETDQRYDEARLAQVRLRQQFALGKIRETGAVVEICPASNRRISGHRDITATGVRRLVAAKVPFVVGTDNPGLLDVTLSAETKEAARAGAAAGCSPGGLRRHAWERRSEVLSGRARASAAGVAARAGHQTGDRP